MHYPDKLIPSSKKGRDWTRKGVDLGSELTVRHRSSMFTIISRGLSRRLHCHMWTPPFGKGFYRINSASIAQSALFPALMRNSCRLHQ
jgi:hypothetical protein